MKQASAPREATPNRRLDKEAILGVDGKELTAREKRQLVKKHFPEPDRASWQEDLKKEWIDAQRWQQYLGIGEPALSRTPYRHTHSRLVEAAKRNRPLRPGTRVADFSEWVFSLYYNKKDPQGLARANYGRSERGRYVPAPRKSGWKLIYEGIRTADRMPKIISALTVAGEPLWAAPDFVFQEKTSGRIVIVQVKVSDAVIPSDGWPNLRAQLWAYAHVDEWLCAREMLLVGEVWDLTLDGIVFRGTVRWECGDREFHRNNLELFELYGGAHTGLPSGERCL